MTEKDLKPQKVFHFFSEINKIPRPSKHEEKMIALGGSGYSISLVVKLIIVICMVIKTKLMYGILQLKIV